ncbi:RNA polymerase sigma-70 factor [Paenibacillus sp. UNC499MF]|uniref:RNA polymerase sigma-70 factor n=1 Tax=Paenibacillus sp. UNC499MF TaxID=1502751 RepID=UPI0008A08F38|nr:RNA polymerase sigma-70 factor [Paenibacillus sp. UNC499MF]SEG66559.1 RNA polymerase sigma-70 factor, ECF subfamily [Paenibacillus sp. UNC499MF]
MTETLYKQYHPLLYSIAYRMLGTLSDAEDIIQDVYLEIQQQDLSRIGNIKAYLCKAVTNRCINFLQSARSRREVYTGEWLPEPSAVLPDLAEQVVQEETVSYALLVMMEMLNPVERAVFILREALQYSYKEIGDALQKSEENCRKIYSRVKTKLVRKEAAPAQSSKREEQFVKLFIEAAKTGDFAAFIAQMTTEAVLVTDGGGKVRCALRPIYGPQRIRALFEGIWPRGYFSGSLIPARINGEPGIVLLRGELPVLAVSIRWDWEQDRVDRLYIVGNPEKLHGIRL